MTWQDRTRNFAFVSPSGTRFAFDFIDANKESDKLTTAFNFPGIPGTYVQDLGRTDRRYPVRAIFWGDDHDLQATAFEGGVRESGRGRLEHPRDGNVSVVSFGTIKTREDLVKDANQTIVEVTFWESTITLYPSGSADPRSAVLSSVQETLTSSATTFAESTDISTAVNRASLRNRFETSIGQVRSVLGAVVAADPKEFRDFKVIADSITRDLDELITTPQVLAEQANLLMQIPANSSATIGAKFDGYTALIGSFTSVDNPDDQLRDTSNDFRNDELFAIGALEGLIASSLAADFATRSEAVTAADTVANQFDVVNEWREVNYAGIV